MGPAHVQALSRRGKLAWLDCPRIPWASTSHPASGEVRRAELVPGVMHCAKCKFQLNRVTLCVSDGNAYAGNNKTEPCPNGCGPLWPVTWEQEAKNCWKALEEMHERLMAAATPQPSPMAQAAESVTAPAGGVGLRDEFEAHWRRKYAPLPMNTRMRDDGRYGDPTIQQEWEAWQAPTPPAQADSVLEDAADPLQGAATWLVQAHSGLETSTLAGKLSIGYNRAKRLHDAARKQGGA